MLCWRRVARWTPSKSPRPTRSADYREYTGKHAHLLQLLLMLLLLMLLLLLMMLLLLQVGRRGPKERARGRQAAPGATAR